MSSRSLVRRALQPGANLMHDGERTVPVDALHALGRAKSEAASVLLRIRYGELDERFPVVVRGITDEVFRRRGWRFDARRHDAVEFALRFHAQVAQEFLGELCPRCAGRGILGAGVGVHARDQAKKRLRACGVCLGTGGIVDRVRSRARALGVDHAAVSRRWGPRMTAVLRRMRLIQNAAFYGIDVDLIDDDLDDSDTHQ